MSDRTIPEEPRWITGHALLAMHAQQIERYGGAHGVLDPNAALSAPARPRNRWEYDPTADHAALAAAYLFGFARSQGFRDGNKRTGLACALVFLHLNDAPLHVPPAELYALTMAVATGRADEAAAATFFRDALGRTT